MFGLNEHMTHTSTQGLSLSLLGCVTAGSTITCSAGNSSPATQSRQLNQDKPVADMGNKGNEWFYSIRENPEGGGGVQIV
jgi:hypothetical protein